MKHYVLLHRKPSAAPLIEGVFHEPTEPITRARASAACLCSPDRYGESAHGPDGEVFRATYGAAGECFVVLEAPPRTRVEAGAPPPAKRSPSELRRWALDLIADCGEGEWDLVDGLIERDVITREVPGSPFLGKHPGPNLFCSLHLRLNEEARAQLNITDEARAQVKAALEDDEE